MSFYVENNENKIKTKTVDNFDSSFFEATLGGSLTVTPSGHVAVREVTTFYFCIEAYWHNWVDGLKWFDENIVKVFQDF